MHFVMHRVVFLVLCEVVLWPLTQRNVEIYKKEITRGKVVVKTCKIFIVSIAWKSGHTTFEWEFIHWIKNKNKQQNTL